MLRFIDGAVVKNSDTTIVKYVLSERLMSQTRRKMTLLADKLLKTRRKMQLLPVQMLKTRRKITILAGKLLKTRRKIALLPDQISKKHVVQLHFCEANR